MVSCQGERTMAVFAKIHHDCVTPVQPNSRTRGERFFYRDALSASLRGDLGHRVAKGRHPADSPEAAPGGAPGSAAVTASGAPSGAGSGGRAG